MEQINSIIENKINQNNNDMTKFIKSETESNIKKINLIVEDLNKKIESNKSELDNYKKNNQIKVESLQKKIQKEIENLKNQINSNKVSNEKNFIDIEKIKNKYKSEMKSLNKELEKLFLENENIKKQNLKQDNEIKTLNEKINRNNQQIEDVNNKIEINEKARKNRINILNNTFKNFCKNYGLNNQKRQKEIKFKLFSEKKYATVGLKNIGNNCYINSVLQVLKNIPKFTFNITKFNDKSEKFLFSLKNLLINICSSDVPSFSPEEFRRILGTENRLFSGNIQYDSTIFYVALLNIINKKLNKEKKENYKRIEESKYENKSLKERFEIWKENYLSKNQTFIFELLYGYFSVETECNSCKNKNQGFQTFNYLDFPIVSEKGLIKNLKECFENYKLSNDKIFKRYMF